MIIPRKTIRRTLLATAVLGLVLSSAATAAERVVIVGTNGTILVSNDSGQTWTEPSSGTVWDLRAVSFVNPMTGWTGGQSGQFSMTDNGQSWVALTNPFSATEISDLHFVDHDVGYLVSNAGDIAWTTDGSANWSTTTVLDPLKGVFFLDATTGWICSNDNSLYFTTDGMQNLNEVFLPGQHNDVFFIDASNGWAAGPGGSIIRSTDGGNNWTVQDSGTHSDLNKVWFVDAATGWAVGQNGTILHTSDAGANWSLQTSSTTAELLSLSMLDASTGWAVGRLATVLHTTDGGTTWTSQAPGTSPIEDLYDVAVQEFVVPDPEAIPSGTIVAWHRDLPGVPALTEGWVECDGQVVSDPLSPLDGVRLPCLNDERCFLRGSLTPGVLQGDAFQGHRHDVDSSADRVVPGTILGTCLYFPAPPQLCFLNPFQALPGSIFGGYSIDDPSTGPVNVDSETRPINMSVVWIVKTRTASPIPIGSIVAWHRDLEGTPPLPFGWRKVDGQLIDAPGSPLDGELLPDLNGDSRFLRGGTLSGVLQDHAIQDHQHDIIHDAEAIVSVALGPFSDFATASVSPADVIATDPFEADHGPTRADFETRPDSMDVVWILKVDDTGIPLGSILAWNPALFPLPPETLSSLALCNGEVLQDLASPFDGVSLPDLNDTGRFLRGADSSGGLQDDAFQSHWHSPVVSASAIFAPPAGPFGGAIWTLAHAIDAPATVSVLGPISGRFGDETRPVNMSVQWLMKVKRLQPAKDSLIADLRVGGASGTVAQRGASPPASVADSVLQVTAEDDEPCCQMDLGMGMPGDMHISVCGDALTHSSGRAEFLLTGAAPQSTVDVIISPDRGRLVLGDATVFPDPATAEVKTLRTNAEGVASFPLAGQDGVRRHLWVQALAWTDAGYAVSNLLRVTTGSSRSPTAAGR